MGTPETTFLISVLVATWIAIALLGLALAGVLRQLYLLRGGTVSGVSETPPLIGQVVAPLQDLGVSARRAVLLFGDEACPRCELLISEADSWSRPQSEIPVLLVLKEMAAVHPKLPKGVRVLNGSGDLLNRVRVPVVPYAVTMDAEGAVLDAAPIGSTSGMISYLERTNALEGARDED